MDGWRGEGIAGPGARLSTVGWVFVPAPSAFAPEYDVAPPPGIDLRGISLQFSSRGRSRGRLVRTPPGEFHGGASVWASSAPSCSYLPTP
jgi:hypothetical protein